jgi:hypothetical protein
MHVRFNVPRHVKVHHVRHPFDVQPARRHVGGEHQRALVIHELLERRLALVLPLIAVHRHRSKAELPKRFGQILNPSLGVRERHDPRAFRELAQDVVHLLILLVVGGVHEFL